MPTCDRISRMVCHEYGQLPRCAGGKVTGTTASKTNELRHEICNNVVCVNGKDSNQTAHRCCLIRAFASGLNILC